MNNIGVKKRGRPRKTELGAENKKSESNKKKISEIKLKEGPCTRSKSKRIIDNSFARYTRISEVKDTRSLGAGRGIQSHMTKLNS